MKSNSLKSYKKVCDSFSVLSVFQPKNYATLDEISCVTIIIVQHVSTALHSVLLETVIP
jgi:hypothetical protein